MEIRKKIVSGIAATLSAAMLVSVAACGGNDSASDGPDDGSFMKVDVFSSTANYQGVQKGWFAKIVKDKFNMELNIIAPNVAGGGDTLFDTRSTAGNLGDLVIVGMQNGRLQKLVKSKLITDMTPYYGKMTNVKRYQAGVDYVTKQAGQDGVWGVPGNVSDESPTKSADGIEPAAARGASAARDRRRWSPACSPTRSRRRGPPAIGASRRRTATSTATASTRPAPMNSSAAPSPPSTASIGRRSTASFPASTCSASVRHPMSAALTGCTCRSPRREDGRPARWLCRSASACGSAK
ncbi:ABC transporter substrate-binding protein [Bifidobacterium anseris]|uniref:ABC transporter substrate-binding protein n=1 Tax=Bifidobacterium anseris TaxID=2020963 RepID=A0A2N5J029_9BIFI|nr:hypothetical protein [Bifidobacterium anseris]PLS27568.1 ABC transporter substrate-binding protein [Bifidobacterium anseris]